jgi:hypothetical protein
MCFSKGNSQSFHKNVLNLNWLTYPQYGALPVLYSQPALGQRELAEALQAGTPRYRSRFRRSIEDVEQ